MTNNCSPLLHAHLYPPGMADTSTASGKTNRLPDTPTPRKPDWLLIMVGILFLLTLAIGWLVAFPG